MRKITLGQKLIRKRFRILAGICGLISGYGILVIFGLAGADDTGTLVWSLRTVLIGIAHFTIFGLFAFFGMRLSIRQTLLDESIKETKRAKRLEQFNERCDTQALLYNTNERGYYETNNDAGYKWFRQVNNR